MIRLYVAVYLPEGRCTATFTYREVLVIRDAVGKDNLMFDPWILCMIPMIWSKDKKTK